jgi:PKD repeat protein
VHNGTVVSFSTTLGHIEPAEAKTTGGQVTVKLIADGRSGAATVTAYSGGATKTLTIAVGAAAAARILVTASPQSLPFPGGNSTINAIVQDGQSNPISGVPIAFSTTKGSLAATTAVTDAFGNATTTLSTTADATVTASAGGSTGTLSGTVTVTIQPNGTVGITAPTGTVTVGSSITFTVTVAGVAVSNVVVDFGDGSQTASLGPISASQVVQHVYNRPGAYTVSATATFVDGSQPKTVTTPLVVQDYTVSASCGQNVTFGATSTFTATVTPSTVGISDYIWDFFDSDNSGTSRIVLHGSPQTHTWTSRGIKTVQLTVVPTSAPQKSTSCQVEVN